MGEFFLLLIGALVVGAIVFGVAVLITGDDPGLEGNEPDGRAIPLPTSRPLGEVDVSQVRFDTGIRGYRMGQVDQAFRRAAYDIGYKEELIQVLEAEVKALREGRTEEADAFRDARQAAVSGATGAPVAAPAAPAVAATADLEAADDDESADVLDSEDAAVSPSP